MKATHKVIHVYEMDDDAVALVLAGLSAISAQQPSAAVLLAAMQNDAPPPIVLTFQDQVPESSQPRSLSEAAQREMDYLQAHGATNSAIAAPEQ